MLFCPFNQEQTCSDKCAIWSKEGRCCALLRLPKAIDKLTEEIIQLEERV